MKVKILGVSGSHRPGRNTSFLVKEALRAAEAMGDVETAFLELWGKDLRQCDHCDTCILPEKRTDIYKCSISDDFEQIWPLVDEADGLVIGSPVFINTMSGILKVFFDRMRPLIFKGSFTHKVAGAVTVAYERIGGQESTAIDIHNALRYMECITVSGYCHGGTAISGVPFGPTPFEDDGVAIGVANDRFGLRQVRFTGRKVAEIALLLKAGKVALGPERLQTFCQGYHPPLAEKDRRWFHALSITAPIQPSGAGLEDKSAPKSNGGQSEAAVPAPTVARPKGKMVVPVRDGRCTACGSCELQCSFRFEKQFNPLSSLIRVTRVDGRSQFTVSEACDGCGQCVRSCLYDVLAVQPRR